MKVFLVGGGTGGPTAPLVAVAKALLKLKPRIELFVVGLGSLTLEAKFFKAAGLSVKYLSIPAGKWRRYFSLWNFVDILKIFVGFIKSFFLLRRHRPDVIFGAGSFVQVPLVWAAFFFRIPVVVHQQDVRLLLSTKLTAPFARAVTSSFDFTALQLPTFSGMFRRIPKSKIVATGNPVRPLVLSGSKERAREIFGLTSECPTVLVMGGGAGAAHLNEIVWQALSEFVKYVQIIHATGDKKVRKDIPIYPRYHQWEFLSKEIGHAYAAADLVICRGGMSTISELAVLGKPAIVVPLPDSPQEDNARLLALMKSAVVVFEEFLTCELLVRLTRKILWSGELPQTLGRNIGRLMPRDAGGRIAKILIREHEKSRKK